MNDVQELFESSQGLVRSLALKAHARAPSSVALDDLIGYGQVGLAEAAQAFQPGMDANFSTFAYYRIRGAIYDGLAQMTGWSRSQRRRLKQQQATSEHLRQQAEASGSLEDETLADHCNWLVETTMQLATICLAADVGSGADDVSVDYRFGNPAEAVAQEELLARLKDAVEALPEGEAAVIRQFYFEGQTLTEVARQNGKDKSWASRLHSKAVSRLANELRQAAGKQAVSC